MSKLFPKDSFTLHSDLSAEAIAAQLTHAIALAPAVRTPWNRPKTPYSGKVTPTGFEAIRVIHYRNSFLPQVRGQFEPLSPSGTAVHITLAPHPVILAFLAVWYFHWYGISLLALFTGGMPGAIALLFLGLPLVIGFAFWAAFWTEAKRSRRDFAQLIGQA